MLISNVKYFSFKMTTEQTSVIYAPLQSVGGVLMATEPVGG